MLYSIAAAILLVMTQDKSSTPNVETFFQNLTIKSLHLVDDFYDADAVLVDPLGEHRGLSNIKAYYKNLYENLEVIHFDFHGKMVGPSEGVYFWTMTYEHPRINGGREVRVEGNSHVRISPKSKKVTYHRDTFDMGAMIYEHIPVLGWIISSIKKKMKGEPIFPNLRELFGR